MRFSSIVAATGHGGLICERVARQRDWLVRIALAGRVVGAGGVVGDELGEVLQQMRGAADAVLGT